MLVQVGALPVEMRLLLWEASHLAGRSEFSQAEHRAHAHDERAGPGAEDVYTPKFEELGGDVIVAEYATAAGYVT